MQTIQIPRPQRHQLAIAFTAGRKADSRAGNPFVTGAEIDPCSTECALVGAFQAGRYYQAGDALLASITLHGAKRSMQAAVKLGRVLEFR